MRALYPHAEPYAVHRIAVDEPHQIFLEECGNPRGVPVVFLHGGPGSGCSPDHRRYFDPEFFRIILVDQRGSGRSQPLGETAANTTRDLVYDMESIRRHLGIERWMLFGGSWGATLALVYALTHPDHILGMVLRGSFLAREEDLEWFLVGLRRLLPSAWEQLTRGIAGCRELGSLIDWYHAALHGEDRQRSLDAARRWSEWGGQVVNWHKPGSGENGGRGDESEEQLEQLLAKVRIETHYARHRYFIRENEILDRLDLLPGVPVSIIHGCYDLTCIMESAWLLHRAIPGSRLVEVSDAGHLIDDPAMISALVEETDRVRDFL
ncbi:MAG: prolyl aminopeptidase [Candidatus Thiodiazotropha sp. (ex Ctena orbiculata)]|nr:prolyl aminopeptidase [Candidatus Thiodiazotropha taylori]MBT2996517.1 prolyl aminopeptidase [Candidatus Thiodiazotropha taylori]MBT3000557.1 prolyl aminopeptidase [Candidatus Thiodiazotropha taylori]MBT3026777.1 prolyl aminopeptidase [Candidatus Thiodiazotropha taylori]MBT3034101.1 prolyl aminopeptidase [Candidatus Thiodiazotropha taylori]